MGTQKIALRVREAEVTKLITLKGSSKTADWGGVEREEIEMWWCKIALTKIFKRLKKIIKMPDFPQRLRSYEAAGCHEGFRPGGHSRSRDCKADKKCCGFGR